MFFLEVFWLAAASWKNGLALLVIFSLAGSTCNRCVLRQELGFPNWILDGYLFIRRTSQSYFFFWESFWIFGVNVSWEESQAWTTTVPSLATALVRTVLRQVRACLAVVKHNLESFCWMICMTAQETITAWCLGWLFCVDQGETTGTSFSFISLRPDLTPGLQCSYRPSNPWLLIWSYQGWLVWPTRWYCVNLRVSSVGLAVSNNLVFARVQTHWYCPPYHQFPY